MKKQVLLLFLLSIQFSFSWAQDTQERGAYFYKKVYTPQPLPTFAERREQLPKPVLTEHPEWIELYWKAWEIAFSNLQRPAQGSPLVTNWIDEGLTPQIFQWDTHFMALFGRYGHQAFPFIESHDNFYARQHSDGMICRILNEADGADHVWGLGENFARTINPPLFSWAEMEYYKFSGDTDRLRKILPPIEKYIAWVEQHRRAHGTPHELFWSNGQASGMDNTPRDRNRSGHRGDIHSATDAMGWVDMSAQMKMCYDHLSEICHILGEKKKAKTYEAKSADLKERINRFMWNDSTGCYHDVSPDGKQTSWITVATFWPILADVASEQQVERLVAVLQDKNLFWRQMPLPSLAANQPYYDKCGNYWQGGVWPPTSYMTVKGLQEKGYHHLAQRIAEKQLDAFWRVYESTGTIWEVYAPDIYMPATTALHNELCRPNFVGWAGVVPISMLIEHVIGITVDGSTNTVTWNTTRETNHGVEDLYFVQNKVSLLREGDLIEIKATSPFKLVFNGTAYQVKSGTSQIKIKE